MALNLNPYRYAVDGGEDVSGFTDQYGQNWRQTPTGGYERIIGQQVIDGGESQGSAPLWGADDPFSSKWGIQGSVGFDASPYLGYLQYAQGAAPRFGDPASQGNTDLLNEWYKNPASLFDSGYNPGSRNSLNPYFTTGIRDSIRDIAQKLGLTSAQADEIALAKAQSDFSASGQGRSDATAVANLADDLARAVFEKAGKGAQYQGLTPQQRLEYGDKAIEFQNRNKGFDEDVWKKDDFGGMAGVWMEQIQNKYEGDTKDPIRILGADNPWNTALWNRVLNEDWDPYGNEYGLPTKQNYEQANQQGYDTGAASLLQQTAQTAAGFYLGATGASGEFTNALGIDQGYVNAANAAKGLNQGYENDDPLAAAKGLGNLYAAADTGTLTDAGPDTGFPDTGAPAQSPGTTGGGMWDEYGNWVDDGGFQDHNAGAYNDPFYDGSGTDTSGQYDPYAGVDPFQGVGGGDKSLLDYLKGAGGSLQGLLGGLFGGGGAPGTTGTTGAAGGLNLQKLLGALGATGLGIAGSKNVANKYDSMANRFEGYGADYRTRLAGLYNDPNSFLQSQAVQAPVQQGTDALARSLSIHGNPAGSPAAMGELQNYASNQLFGKLGQEKDRLAQLSGIPQYAAAAPGAASKAADAAGGQYTAAGYGLDQAMNPQDNSLASFLKQLKQSGLA